MNGPQCSRDSLARETVEAWKTNVLVRTDSKIDWATVVEMPLALTNLAMSVGLIRSEVTGDAHSHR